MMEDNKQAKFVLPSSADVRKVLENLPETEVRIKVGTWDITINGKQAKMGLLFQYLTASRVAEVFGKYAPQAKHCIDLRVEGENAVLFVVKTAKKKTKRGWILRPVLIPNNPRYEYLTLRVRDYMKSFPESAYPFLLAPNRETSKRYAEAYMKTLFEEHRWSFVLYIRSAYAHPSLGYTFDPQKRTRKLIPEKEALSHGVKITYDRTHASYGWVPISIRIDSRWKPINTMVLRKIRLRELNEVYDFEPSRIDIYAGWSPRVALVARHYIKKDELELDIDEDPELVRKLARMGKLYFKYLLLPIDNLMNPLQTKFDGIEIL